MLIKGCGNYENNDFRRGVWHTPCPKLTDVGCAWPYHAHAAYKVIRNKEYTRNMSF